MPEEPASEAYEPGGQRIRRPVVEHGAEPEPRPWGCLLIGAVLGIAAGAAFAFYALPPLLRHFYGERHVAVGQTYEGDSKIMTLATSAPIATEASGSNTAGFTAEFAVTINKTWTARAADFSLEFDSGGDWVRATAIAIDFDASATLSSTIVDFDASNLAEPHRLRIAFPPHPGNPRYLHLSRPPVRFALQGVPDK